MEYDVEGTVCNQRLEWSFVMIGLEMVGTGVMKSRYGILRLSVCSGKLKWSVSDTEFPDSLRENGMVGMEY